MYQNESENILTCKIVEFGKKSGFIFSKDDLMAAYAEIQNKKNENNELSSYVSSLSYHLNKRGFKL